MPLRRGFKSEAHAIAREVRAELGLRSADALDPRALAAHLEVPVYGISELQAWAPDAVRYFQAIDTSAFSAVTIFRGSVRTIWHNDAHALVRQASNIAHELAHALLLHEPGPALTDDGTRAWDSIVEEEAHWLGAALLVSDEAAFAIAASGGDLDVIAQRYGVSRALLDFRLNVTAATLRAARARRLS